MAEMDIYFDMDRNTEVDYVKEIVDYKAKCIDAHMVSVDALCKRYDTDVDKGLTEEQAKENLEKYGENRMNVPTMVKRDGEYQKILGEDLVPGDIVLIEAGTDITGDIRIVEIMEPVLVESYYLYRDYLNYLKEMTTEQTSEDPLETNNLIFKYTSIFAGRCIGMVFKTGDNMLLNFLDYSLLAPPRITDSDDEGKRGFWDSDSESDSDDNNDDDDDDDDDGRILEERPSEISDLNINYHEITIEEICEQHSTDVEKGLTTEQAAINQIKSGKNKFTHYFEDRIQDYTMCKRDGEFQHLLSKRLTAGDIISLKAPQVIPADIRIIEASLDATVNKSSLTGESGPKKLSLEKTHDNPIETENVAVASTKLTKGTCTGIVVNVGQGTLGALINKYWPYD